MVASFVTLDAIDACRTPRPACHVGLPARTNLENEIRGYLHAVVAELACHAPTANGPYADTCWDVGTGRDPRWQVRPAMFGVSTTVSEMGGRLTVGGAVAVGDAWLADWSASTGWKFGYLWADRWWDSQWQAAQQFGKYGDRIPAAKTVAAELATFLNTDPLSVSVPTSGDDVFEGYASGDVETDREVADLAMRLGTAAAQVHRCPPTLRYGERRP
jgi:hypothetical protein